jgi:nucleoside-diphosphate-sugar epimerase
MRNLVTGSTGFIGSHLVEALLLRGEQVEALARPTSNVHHLRELGAEVRVCTLEDQATLVAASSGVDRIWHCAALVDDWGPPDTFVQANVEGTRNILAAATRAKASRFIYLSTSDVYGFPGRATLETEKPAPRGLPYVDTKIEGESLVWNHSKAVGLPVTVLRPGTVYGPRSRALVLPIVQALIGRKGYLIDHGKHLAGLCYVGNLVDALLLAGDSTAALGQAYNITDGSQVTWADFINALADAIQMPHPVRNYSHWQAYTMASLWESYFSLLGRNDRPRITKLAVELMGTEQDFPIDKARSQLGYRPRVSFADGIKATVDWLKKSNLIDTASKPWTNDTGK